jgi:3-oxoacyl-[acyl-carrier protein] reductase
MDLGIEGRACVVTGGSSGIGLATARLLSAEGARVLLVGRREEALAEAAASLNGGAETLAVDVTNEGAAERIAAACEGAFGRVDVLVSNAGTSRNRPLDELTDAEWQDQWELHVMASLRLMRAVAPGMAERGWGRIVNVGSSSGKRPSLSNAAYTVTKAAQHMLARVFADTYAAKGVLVNTVSPGPVETPLWMAEGGLADQAAEAQGISRDEALEGARGKLPIGRFGTEEEIAAVIAFLCSERASNVAGANWSVDGGAVPLPL